MAIVTYYQFNVLTQPDPANPTNTIMHVQPGPHGLFSGGVVMDIVIGVDSVTAQSLQTANIPVPSPVTARALVDTGCTITSIDSAIVSALQLKTRGFTQTHTANGTMNVSQHQISLNFPGTNLSGRHVQTVQTVDLSGQPFGVLIGQDIMASWSITYNGTTGFVCIAD